MRLAIAMLVVSAHAAAADTIAVKVTEVAGGVAFVTPGRKAGLARDTKLMFHGRAFVVAEVTDKTAAVQLGSERLAVGDTGTADVTPGAAAAVAHLAKPHAADAFADQWPEPVRPATTQSPDPVPLGNARTAGDAHVTVIGHGYGVASRDGFAGDAEGRVIGSFALAHELPLAADFDVAGRAFAGGIDDGTHVPVFVRAAQLRYGAASDPRLVVGRLRYAASSVGMLDGGRAAARFGSFELAAFGGLVPDPISGKPDTGAARFGGEFMYDDPAAAWQPRVAVTAHGSTWQGQLDERRLSVVASAGHGATWLDGWAEVEAFPAGNPWGASPIEVTGAGATTEWRDHGTHVGLDLTFLRPERSLRLAAALPPEWLCTLAPRAGNVAETCTGGDYWTSASASVGKRTARWSLDGALALGDSHGVFSGFDGSGYVRGELRAGAGRLDAGVSAGRASFASWTAGELGAGFAWSRRIDLSARYSLEQLDYNASAGPSLLHSAIADARLAVSAALDVDLSAIATTGADRDAVALLATFAWRPLP